MEPVYCPNGHPNRPGTRICIICRELIVPSSPPVSPRQPQPSKPGSSPRQSVAPLLESPGTSAVEEVAQPSVGGETAPAPVKRRRLWPWLLLFVLAVVAGAVLLYSLLIPVRLTTTPLPTLPAQTTPVVAVDVATSAPTASPQPPTITSTTSPSLPTSTAAALPTAVATITPLPTVIGVIITPTIAFGPEVNFIQNGSFADDWANGWTLETRGVAAEIAVGPATDEPETQSLRMVRTGPGMARLAQRVVLTFPVEGLLFRGRFRLAGSADGGGEGRAAIILRYEDANGDPVGATVWVDGATAESDLWGANPLPILGPTVSEQYAQAGWQVVELPLAQEFTERLPDVDMESVRQITLALAVIGSESCPSAGCEASLEVAEVSITAEGP